MDFAEKDLIIDPLMINRQGSWSNPIKQSLHWWPNLIFGTFSSWSKSKNWQVVAGRWSVQFSFSASFSGKEGSLEKIVAKCCHGPVATSGSQLVTAKKETATFSTSAEVHTHSLLCVIPLVYWIIQFCHLPLHFRCALWQTYFVGHYISKVSSGISLFPLK